MTPPREYDIMDTSKKGKGGKNKKGIRTVRREVLIPQTFSRKMADDFISMCSGFWQMADNGMTPAERRLGLLQNIVLFCEDAWNISVLADTDEQVETLLDRNYPAENPARNLVRQMVGFKRKNYPADRAIVKDSMGSFGANGKPAIDFRLDYGIMEEEARARQNTMPRMEDIIDREALERALEGVPLEMRQIVLQAEIQRQLDAYNNTPQAELGGKSPNEMLNEKH